MMQIWHDQDASENIVAVNYNTHWKKWQNQKKLENDFPHIPLEVIC